MNTVHRPRLLVLGTLLGLTLTAGLAGCGEAEPTPPVEPGLAPYYTVDHYKVPCEGVGPQLCLRVRRPEGTREWEYKYDGIENLTYSWGTRYELTVRTEEVPDPPADGSSIREIATDVFEAGDFAGERFQIQLFTPELIAGSAADGFLLGGERELRCASEAVCTAFEAALPDLGGSSGLELDLAHPAKAGEPLVLHTITAASR